MTDGAEQELILERPENVDVLADARAGAGSWSPNTRRAYVTGWRDFTRWCLENRCAGLPSALADVGRYLEHLVETEGKALATAPTRLAAITAAHRLGGHPDPVSRPLVKATLKRLAREYGKPRKQAKGLTSEALAAVKATARIQRVDQGKRRRRETKAGAARRALNQCQGGMCILGVLETTERTPRLLISPSAPAGSPPTVWSGNMYISPWLYSLMLLWMSRFEIGHSGGDLQGRVDFTNHVAFETTDDLGLAHSLPGAAMHVLPGSEVMAKAGQNDAIESAIGLPVAAPVAHFAAAIDTRRFPINPPMPGPKARLYPHRPKAAPRWRVG